MNTDFLHFRTLKFHFSFQLMNTIIPFMYSCMYFLLATRDHCCLIQHFQKLCLSALLKNKTKHEILNVTFVQYVYMNRLLVIIFFQSANNNVIFGLLMNRECFRPFVFLLGTTKVKLHPNKSTFTSAELKGGSC